MDYIFKLKFKVRDYECDMQGIVNNANYQHYLEHARHEFLLASKLNFAEFTKKGINLIVAHAELNYKFSLRSGDQFWVGINVSQPSKVRFEFQQDIYRQIDHKLILTAKITAVATNPQGKIIILPELQNLIKQIT